MSIVTRHLGCAALAAVLALAACENTMSPLPDSREGQGAEGLEGWDWEPPPVSWAPYASAEDAAQAAARCLTADDLREVGWSALAPMLPRDPEYREPPITCATCHASGQAGFLVERDPALQVQRWQSTAAYYLLSRPVATETGADLRDPMRPIEHMVAGPTLHPAYDVEPIRAIVAPLHARARARFLAGACR